MHDPPPDLPFGLWLTPSLCSTHVSGGGGGTICHGVRHCWAVSQHRLISAPANLIERCCEWNIPARPVSHLWRLHGWSVTRHPPNGWAWATESGPGNHRTALSVNCRSVVAALEGRFICYIGSEVRNSTHNSSSAVDL